MELEFYNLYNVLTSYKRSIVRNLAKIDECVLQTVNNYENRYSQSSISKKYNISLEMVGVLQNYVNMLYMSESLLEELKTKLEQLERDCRPERCESERRSSNAFLLPPFNVLPQSAESRSVKSEIIDSLDTSESPSLISDTETLVDTFTETGPEFIINNLKDANERQTKFENVLEHPFFTEIQSVIKKQTSEEEGKLDKVLPEKEFVKKNSSDIQHLNEISSKKNINEVTPERERIMAEPIPQRIVNETTSEKNKRVPHSNKIWHANEMKLEQSTPQHVVNEVKSKEASEFQYVNKVKSEKSFDESIVVHPAVSQQPNEVKYERTVGIHLAESQTGNEIKSEKNIKRVTLPEETIKDSSPKKKSVRVHPATSPSVVSEVKPEKNNEVPLLKKEPTIPPCFVNIIRIEKNQKETQHANELKSEKPMKEIPLEIETVKVHEIKPEKSPSKPKSPVPSCSGRRSPEPEYTALTKLLSMTVHDRRKEAEKKFEKKKLPSSFKWKSVHKSPNVSPTPRDVEKKTREKSAIYELIDDVLIVNQVCCFSHIVSPSEFYLRTNQKLFERLENSINEDLNSQYQYVVGSCKSKNEAKSILGRFCFVFLSSKVKWFRVRVLDWMEHEPVTICVQLIDYGEKCYCNYENLKCMTELYAKFPRMATRCHFAGVYSPDPENTHKWPEGSIHAFIDLSEIKKMTNFVVIYAHKEGNSYGVDLMKSDDQNEKTLAQILVENEMACQIELPEETQLDIIMEEELTEYDNINEAVAGYDAQDEARICPFTDSSGKCFKGPSCKLEHSKLSADGITTDKELIVSEPLVSLTPPRIGEYIYIVITGYINTCHFYAQIITNKNQSEMCNREFQNLFDIMNSNNNVQTYVPFKIYPGIGEMVITKHENQWYRARCVGHGTCSDTIEVFIVDFGVMALKTLTELRQMKDDFMHLPFQAVECKLDSCCEKSDADVNASANFFTECMSLQKFRARVTGRNEALMLTVWDLNNMLLDYILDNYDLVQNRGKDLNPDEKSILQLHN